MRTTVILADHSGPAEIETVLARLKSEPLDRHFERAFGGFVQFERQRCDGRVDDDERGLTSIIGAFVGQRHAFEILTDEPRLIRQLRRAISANRRRPDYVSQPAQ